MTEIICPATPGQLDQVRDLMRAFVAWHRKHHLADIALIDRYFDAAEFEQELGTLPGKYTPPTGRLLLAIHAAKPAGCVALRDLGDGICEMKRMFVYTDLHGRGIGRALADRVVTEARDAGYERMRLDTSVGQAAAIGLYKSAGFRLIAPYYSLPDDIKHWLVFMELSL
jgi:ribosomal protein S18 acetylase RimI-like enzyme